jgi:iron complex outermembrane receptor protein
MSLRVPSWRTAVAVCLSILTVAATAFAQHAAPAGRVSGAVTDQSGGVVVAAVVRLEPTAGGPAASVKTDEEGRFVFAAVAPGDYLVTSNVAGFEPAAMVVTVTANETAAADLQLTAAGILEEVVVTVTRVATPVSAIPNTVTIVDEKAVAARTAASDDLASLLESNVPGFAPSMKKMTGRGETLRGRNPLYTINGVPQHTALRDGERDGHTIDLDFVDRIEVVHGANAIQGIGATGGVINLVTKAPRRDGSLTQDVKLSFGNSDSFDQDGWSGKFSYLLGKRFGRLDLVAGAAVQKRGMFFDASGNAIGLFPTQGDIMDSSSRGFYAKGGFDFTGTRRLEVLVNDFRLERDGDFVSVAGNRATGKLSTSARGNPRPFTGDPAVNDSLTVSADYRDKAIFGGDLSLQIYAQDYNAQFEGGAFTTFVLTPGGPAFLDQSVITSQKQGAKLTYSATRPLIAGILPTLGLDITRDRTEQWLLRTNRTWVPETIFEEAAPFVQLQRVFGGVLVSGGARAEFARVVVPDFTTLPSSRNTAVSGGKPSFSHILPNAGIVVPVARALSVYASGSQGFTMPDVGRVLRAVNTPGQDVDRLVDIEPVIANNVEFGGDYRLKRASLHASWYRSTSDRGSLLERDADNIFHVRRQPTRISGVDLAGELNVKGTWFAGMNYAWIQGRYDSNADGALDTDLDGLNIAPNRLNVFLRGNGPKSSTIRLQTSTLFAREFSGTAAAAGRNFSGYTTADLALAVPTRVGTLRAGIENLLDKQYVIYFSQVDPLAGNDTFFAGPGRSFTLAIERRF